MESAIRIQIEALGCRMEPCGSRVTCDPAPADTDEDWLVAAPPEERAIGLLVSVLSEQGFKWESGGEHYQQAVAGTFMSWRKGDLNLIVSSSQDFLTRHRAATAVCKRLNLMDKQDRIALFQAVLYGNQWNGSQDQHGRVEPAQDAEIAF